LRSFSDRLEGYLANKANSPCFCEVFMTDYFCIGRIVKPHGIKGEVVIAPDTPDIQNFKRIKEMTLEKNGKKQSVKVNSVKFFKGTVIVGFEEVNDMNEAEKLRNWEVIIKREDASPLGENEFYVADMIGADIIDENGNKLGEFKDILDTAGGRIMVFESSLLTTKKGNPKEMLVPYIPQYILNKDIENRKIMIKVIPGLLD